MIYRIVAVCLMVWTVCAQAEEMTMRRELPLRELDCSMREIYLDFPKDVECLKDMFEQGKFYKRLRINSFVFDWKDEMKDAQRYVTRKNHYVIGVGGSFVYKSAYLNGFGVTAGVYASRSYGSLADDEVRFDKAGKDALSRYDLLRYGKRYIISLAQAYGEYRYSSGSFRLGRQIFESLLLKSNDTKMIPNTFEGVSWRDNGLVEGLILQAGYFWKQKLRDHSVFHHVFAYGDDPNDPFAQYSQNDDAAMHRGITLSALNRRGIKDRLLVLSLKSYFVKNLETLIDVTSVPSLLSTATLQARYGIYLDDVSILPSIRYMRQIDQEAGAIAGANIQNNTTGYRNPDSLDATLLALKTDIVTDKWKMRLGYSDVADKGDFVAPWRGFPTGGFTRAMGQYNWQAGTRTAMVQFDIDLEKAGVAQGLKVVGRYAMQDYDDRKPGVQADSNVVTLDVFKSFESIEGLRLRIRYGKVEGKNDTVAIDGTLKPDPSYQEARVELNYLF